jgi:hypothetical protein
MLMRSSSALAQADDEPRGVSETACGGGGGDGDGFVSVRLASALHQEGYQAQKGVWGRTHRREDIRDM